MEQKKRTAKPKIKPPIEAKEQKALIEWATLSNIPLVHHANEGKRTPKSGHSLKKMGLSPGYPDLSLMIARGGYFGLFIELKQNRQYAPCEMKKPIWKAQSEWITRLANEHYFALFCFGWEHAKNVIESYLKQPKTPFHSSYVRYDDFLF